MDLTFFAIEGEKDMLQDLDYGRLENEFRNVYPAEGDTVVCFRGNMALVNRNENNELRLPTYVRESLKKDNFEIVETTDLESVMPELDILYMTRVQGERFFNEEEYLRLRDSYILTPEKLANAKPDMSILHPLPRVNEISVAIDNDSRACYFKQVLNGKYMRMALILMLLGVE